MSDDSRTFSVEEVSEPAPVAKGQVPRDVLNTSGAPEVPADMPEGSFAEGFVAETPEPAAGNDALRDDIIGQLRTIYDPEIPVNIYDMGLIYGVDVDAGGVVDVTMTLTTPSCPVAETMPGEVEARVLAVGGVQDCRVNLVWEPPWDMSKMSDEARLELGFM